MKKDVSYSARFGKFSENALYQSIDPQLQVSIRDTGFRHGLSYQELRQVTEIAIDLDMWGEPSLIEQVRQLERELRSNGSYDDKKTIIDILRDRWISLKQQETRYGMPNKRLNNRPESRKVIENDGGQNIESATPSTPVEILGMNNSAFAGDDFIVVETEVKAKEINLENSHSLGVGSNNCLDSSFEKTNAPSLVSTQIVSPSRISPDKTLFASSLSNSF